MKSIKVQILSFVMIAIFAFAMVTIASNTFMTAEEELIETIHQISKQIPDDGYKFSFANDAAYLRTSSFESAKFTLYSESFKYETPLIDIPLMPPELTTRS